MREMRKNGPFPRRPVAVVPPHTERREVRVQILTSAGDAHNSTRT